MYFWWWPNFGKRPSGDAEKLSSVPVWRTWKGEILALLGHNGAGKSGAEAASLRKSVGRVPVKSFNRFLENWAQIGKEVRPDLLKSFWSFWFGKLSWGLPRCRCLQGFCLPQRQVKEVRERADVDEPIRRFQMILVISSHNPCMSLGNCKSDVLLCRQTSA